MKRFAFPIAILSIAMVTTYTSAGEPEQQAEELRQESAAKQQWKSRSQKGFDQSRRSAVDRDPQLMAARLIQQFDKDNDQKLDSTELASLLTTMRQRRGPMGPGAREGKAGQGRPGQGGRRDQSEPGGDRPKRPKAEEV